MPLFSNNGRNNGRDENPANQEIIDAIEAQLEAMDPEEREAVLALDDAMDRLAVMQLKRQYDADIELIPGDRHHIIVDGERMGYAEFNTWMQAHQILDDAIAGYEARMLGDNDYDDDDDDDNGGDDE